MKKKKKHFGVYIQKKQKSLSGRDLYTPIFIAALLKIAKAWKQSKCSSMGEQFQIYIYFNLKKEGNSAFYNNMDNMDETGGCYAK